jgi:hypothetical protein
MPDRVHVNIHSRASLFAPSSAGTLQPRPHKPAATRRHPEENPVCVKVSGPGALYEHVVAGTQFDNMPRMARARRGGGRPTIRGLGREARRARSVPLREAVQGGVWDADAVADALLGVEPRSF